MKFISLILGLIFLQITLNQSGIQNINGVLFLVISNNSFSTMFSVINVKDNHAVRIFSNI